jgi:Domain of unknown function, B. Theta Gene description (DUF3871)
MELVVNNKNNAVVDSEDVITAPKSSFIEANTIPVTLEHLRKECTIPVFSKDNETTISHYQFIEKAFSVAKNFFGDLAINDPDIRVSHSIKGRIPDAIGKPAKDLQEHERTLYYERCAFMIGIQTKEVVNGNALTLTVGGVRAYNLENLYSKKTVEKFKIFIGFQNKVCTNLCISTDGFSNEVRITSVEELENNMVTLFSNYDKLKHLGMMERMSKFHLNEEEFAHLIGKIRMYQYLDREEQKRNILFSLNDGQINSVVRDYYNCPNFSRDANKNINLWNLYNLLTEANKSSYIDSNLERNVNAYEFVNYITNSLQNQNQNWFLI